MIGVEVPKNVYNSFPLKHEVVNLSDVKLEEDNMFLFYNFPFGQTRRYVLTSLAIMKLTLAYMDKFVTIFLTSLMTKITQSFFNFRESEKGRKGNSSIAFL